MNNKNTFSRILFIILVLSFLFFLFTKIMISIKNSTYKNADEEIHKLTIKKNEMRKLEKRLNEYLNVGKEYGNIKNNRFIKYKNIALFRERLQKLLSKYNFLSSNYNFSGKEILGEFVKIPINIKLVGQYKDLKKFIYDVNNMENFICIISVKLQKNKTNIIGNFSTEVYFVK